MLIPAGSQITYGQIVQDKFHNFYCKIVIPVGTEVPMTKF